MQGQIRGDIAKARHKALSEAIRKKNLAFRQAHHLPLNVLFETEKESSGGYRYNGFDQYFNPVILKSAVRRDVGWMVCEQYEVKDEGNVVTL